MAEATVVPDRRAEDPKLTAITARIDDLAQQHQTIAVAVAENTVITKKIEASTSGLVEAWEAISGGLKVLNFLGKCAKWIALIATAITAGYSAFYAVTHGMKP